MKAAKNPLLAIIVIVNTILGVYILAKQYAYDDKVIETISQSSSPSEAPIKSPYIPEPKEGHKIVEYPFGDFSINLARPSGPQRFIKVSITLLVETPANKNLTEIINKTPALRDEIIDIFNTKTPREVLKLEGRAVLKNLLLEHFNRKLKDDHIIRVLFTKFTVS